MIIRQLKSHPEQACPSSPASTHTHLIHAFLTFSPGPSASSWTPQLTTRAQHLFHLWTAWSKAQKKSLSPYNSSSLSLVPPLEGRTKNKPKPVATWQSWGDVETRVAFVQISSWLKYTSSKDTSSTTTDKRISQTTTSGKDREQRTTPSGRRGTATMCSALGFTEEVEAGRSTITKLRLSSHLRLQRRPKNSSWPEGKCDWEEQAITHQGKRQCGFWEEAVRLTNIAWRLCEG